MSIKVQMFIKLPYILKLEESKDYLYSFTFEEFEMFKLELRFNDEEDEELYNTNYPDNSCSNIRVEAIYKNCNYLDYKLNRIPYADETINEYTVDIPFQKTKEIFGVINDKVNQILDYLRVKTNMFWIEDLPINPVGYYLGSEIEFRFYSPNARLTKSFKDIISYTDYYMISKKLNGISNVDSNIFEGFEINNEYSENYNIFLNKAEKVLYENKFEDFIIYCSISVESFIRRYIAKIEPVGDIVFNHISKSNYGYLNLYYNILLKYLKGKSLKELDEGVFTLLTRMYNLRNSLMHNGSIDEDALNKVGLDVINFEECKKILDSAKKGFKLINNL